MIDAIGSDKQIIPRSQSRQIPQGMKGNTVPDMAIGRFGPIDIAGRRSSRKSPLSSTVALAEAATEQRFEISLSA